MKARIIRTLILTIALLPTMSTFRYLDKECFYLGHSMLNKDNIIRPLGIKVLLHTSCPCAIELMDIRNNGNSCYFSWIPNLSCTPQPQEENRLLSYLAGDSNILLCEEDSKGAVCYKVLKRGKDSFLHEEKVSNDEAGKLITEIMTSQNSWTNVTNFDTTMGARDCCLHLIIILVLLLIIEISGIILTIRRCKMSE